MMVVFQFAISTALIIGTVVVFQQIQHAKERPVGFDREGIIHISIRTQDLAKETTTPFGMIFCLQAQWIIWQIGFSQLQEEPTLMLH